MLLPINSLNIFPMSPDETSLKILKTLSVKATSKQVVFDNTLNVFNLLKEVLQEIKNEFNAKLKDADKRVWLEFKDGGKFESELKVAGDRLIFSMHSNIFEFDREHKAWELEYIKEDITRSYCGIINIYNFLNDSFKYNREEDLGYLIARIFVNKESHFFVEGKRQLGFGYKVFGKSLINKDVLKEILRTSILYALEFDLLVPPYETVKLSSVAIMQKKMQRSLQATGKRIGFGFNTDDISE